jgi:gluconate 2-dehydrogenase gamma chain
MKRRIFLKVSGAGALVPAAGTALTPQATPPAGGASAAAGEGGGSYLFFSAPDGPSALQAGVPAFIDRQLHGAWGAGERLYRSGPWQAGTPSQGYQLPLTPAEMFRTAMRVLRDELQSNGGTPFEQLPGQQQDAILTALQNGQRDLGSVPGKVFFDALLAMTIEGYFCDPVYGGNKGMAAWAMIGFPGAYGAYYDLVDRYGVAFNHPPRSLAENGSGHIAVDPNIPATLPAHAGHGKGHT